MIMALIRLRANIHTLQQLQSYRQSEVQIEPAAVWYRWALTLNSPRLVPKYRDMQSASSWTRAAGASDTHVGQGLLPSFALSFHHFLFVEYSIRNYLETPPQPVSICAPSPSAILSSLMGRSECTHGAWRSTSLSYTWKLFPANATDMLLLPNLTSRSFVVPYLSFIEIVLLHRQASARASSERPALWNPWCEQHLELGAILIRVSF